MITGTHDEFDLCTIQKMKNEALIRYNVTCETFGSLGLKRFRNEYAPLLLKWIIYTEILRGNSTNVLENK